jgi:hypothetical protein
MHGILTPEVSLSEGYVKRLLNPADTLNVLQEMPIRTNDFFKNRLTAKSRTAHGATENFEHVAPGDRISYFDLRVDAMPSRHLNLHVETVQTSATYKTGSIFKKWKNLRPCYYLPYRRNGTTRMKLSPPAGYAGDDILFFATATVDGCSVYVEGPQGTPKVTHANAQKIAPAPTVAETDPAKQLRIQTKIADMDRRMNIIKKGVTTVVERPDYIADYAPGQTAMKQQFATRMGIPLNQVVSYQPFGAVVGVCSGGNWTFYLQKNGQFDYKPTPTSADKSAYMVLSVSEFWPTNTGGFRTF